MPSPICARCGKSAEGYAFIDDQRFCHGDGPSPSCYELEVADGVVIKHHSFATDGMLLPPAPEVCQQCAVDHEPELPHNAQSLYYQYWFMRQRGRWPNWGDAMAHCTADMQDFWRENLAAKGVAESDLVPPT